MFKFLKSSSTPLALRILHFLQHLVLLPAFPIALLCLFGMAVFRTGSLFLLPSPWVFSSISNVILLNKERGATAKGELSKRRYLRLQVLKLAWTVLFFIPIFVAFFTMKGMGFAMLAIFMHYTWFWGSIVWFNGLHWFFVIITLLYGVLFFRGQTEGTIRLQADEPIRLDVDGSTPNDEEIARQLQANEPEWEV